jgi:hypothetical protein
MLMPLLCQVPDWPEVRKALIGSLFEDARLGAATQNSALIAVLIHPHQSL